MTEKNLANDSQPQSTQKLNSQGADGDTIEQFVTRLTDEQRMLLQLKRELYDGSWKAMRQDLNNRLEGKPYIFKLANRIRDDISRIEALQNFEKEHQVSLSEYVHPPESP
jgi:hypothetical protein